MKSLQFTSIIKIRGVNPYILITKEQSEEIKPAWKKPLPVLVRINGKPDMPWHINMMPSGDGSFYLYLHGDIRKASATKVGDKVAVEVGFDSEYINGPQHPVPEWFTSVLEADPEVPKNWEALIPSRKKEILRYFSQLKSQEAINRNLAKVLNVLSGKPGRFIARSWKDGI